MLTLILSIVALMFSILAFIITLRDFLKKRKQNRDWAIFY
jgi:hypothetical protein